MEDYLDKYNALLSSWGPTFLVTGVNFLIPKILALITDFEEWEFAST